VDVERWRREGLETMHFATSRNRRLGWQFFEDARKLPAFPEVRVPALCIAGMRDETVPFEDVKAFVDRTPTARLVPVDDGHDLARSLDVILREARTFLAPFTGPGMAR
jgi:pimeloyl-ACP methyl ester carboxylesterase